MASAQVLPNPAASSRSDLLQAGKKKLEEFRKKKAEGRAKKVASTGQLPSADLYQHEKFSQNNEHVGDGSTTVRNNSSITKPSKMDMDSPSTDIGFSNNTHAASPELFNGDIIGDVSQGKPSKLYESSVVSEPVNGYYGHRRETNAAISAHIFNASDSVGTNPNIGGDSNRSRFQFGSQSGESTRSSKVNVRDYDSSDTNVMNTLPERSGTSSVGTGMNIDEDVNRSRFQFGSQSGESKTSSEVSVRDHDSSDTYTMSTMPERSGSAFAQNMLELPSTSASIYGVNGGTTDGVQQKIPGNMNHGSVFGMRKNINSTGHNINDAGAPWHISVPSTADPSLPDKSFSNQQPFPLNDPGTTSGRSRTFLESLGLARVPSTSHASYYDLPKVNPPISVMNAKSMDVLSQPSTKQLFSEVNSTEQSHDLRTTDKEFSMNSFTSSNDNQPSKLAVSDHLYANHDIQTQKKDEDFAALEQYIEDLTQEKFSLQRALDTSRSLAESLAAENSSLTESYNQQGQVLNQLKSDIDRMQEEVKAQILALESAKMEYTNAQLECNAADERAKILATEVILLEEKALRLRSNELKLEKQLATMNSEVTSYKSKISILEKVRQDLQSTVDAMVEEKKLLQSKIRKASGNINDSSKSSSVKRDASTSTEDLGGGHLNFVSGETNIAGTLQDVTPSLVLSGESSSSSLLPGDGSFLDASSSIPSDQLKMIDNISSLTSELALEKEELIRALMIESSNSSKLKDLNKDLLQKLESQTQRLELLTAQRMANENVQARPMEIQSVHDTPVYADEGDEVVERVLSWIMKLFPGGQSKRRTGKRL